MLDSCVVLCCVGGMYSHFMIQVTGSIADSAELKASPSKDAAAVYGPMLER